MSYHLVDFVNPKKNNFDFDKLIIGKKIKTAQNNSKYYIYYNDGTPKEIYIRLPIIRLIYLLDNYKYNQISLPIYPSWDETSKFLKFIKKLEEYIKEYFSNNKEWTSLINKKNLLNFIKIRINNDVKITSNIKNKKISLSDFKINGQIDTVIKLSFIWANSGKIGLSSQMYQIKYLAPPDQLDINFIDTDTDTEDNNVLNYNQPKQHTQSEQSNQLKRIPPQIILKGIPSMKDLENAIKGLKPIKN